MYPMVTPPPRLIVLSGMFSHHFAIAPYVLGNTLYARTLRHFTRRGDWVTIDNGVTETGQAASLSDLLRAARLVGAHEIVVPDVFDDQQGTRYLLDSVYPRIDALPPDQLPYSFMVVLHGQNIHEVLTFAYEIWVKYPRITTVGIPKVLTKNLEAEGGRPGLLEKLCEHEGLCERFDIHLLGVWTSMREVQDVAQLYGKLVRSIDTSWPIMASAKQVDMEANPTVKIPWSISAKFTDDYLATRNLLVYAAWARGEEYDEAET